MVAHRLRPARCVGVEAQRESFLLASRAVADLPSTFAPVRLVHSDFRDLDLGQRFMLITGSPPYFPTHTGVLPADPQRLACRFEVRGGVEAYCQAAARHLEEGGRLFLVHQTAHDARVLAAGGDAGLYLHGRLDAHMRTDRTTPFLSVYEFAPTAPAGAVARETLSIRGDDGAFTSAYLTARRALGVQT
jgi:tRNA1(Val) A37 N6-methylase TrmN6